MFISNDNVFTGEIMKTAIDLIANLEYKLKNSGLDTIVTLKSDGTTLELEDIMTSRTVAVVKGEDLEDAYANLFNALASSVRRSKNRELDSNSRLTVL